MSPPSVGKQADSTKRSFNVGNFNRGDRQTLSLTGPTRSPGPAKYLPLVRATGGNLSLLKPSSKSSLTGMGTDTRFLETKRSGRNPGPGEYKLPTSVGGYAPDLKSCPVISFSKCRRDVKTGPQSCAPQLTRALPTPH